MLWLAQQTSINEMARLGHWADHLTTRIVALPVTATPPARAASVKRMLRDFIGVIGPELLNAFYADGGKAILKWVKDQYDVDLTLGATAAAYPGHYSEDDGTAPLPSAAESDGYDPGPSPAVPAPLPPVVVPHSSSSSSSSSGRFVRSKSVGPIRHKKMHEDCPPRDPALGPDVRDKPGREWRTWNDVCRDYMIGGPDNCPRGPSCRWFHPVRASTASPSTAASSNNKRRTYDTREEDDRAQDSRRHRSDEEESRAASSYRNRRRDDDDDSHSRREDGELPATAPPTASVATPLLPPGEETTESKQPVSSDVPAAATATAATEENKAPPPKRGGWPAESRNRIAVKLKDARPSRSVHASSDPSSSSSSSSSVPSLVITATAPDVYDPFAF